MRFLLGVFSVACLAAPLSAGEATTRPAGGKVIGKVPADIKRGADSQSAAPLPLRLQAVDPKGKWAIVWDHFVDLPAGTATPLTSLWKRKPQPAAQDSPLPMKLKFAGASPDRRYLLLKALDELMVIYDIQERKDVTVTLDGESNSARWMGQDVVVDQILGKKDLLPIACFGADGKKKDFPKVYGGPLGASEDGKILVVGAFSEHIDQPVEIREAVKRARTEGAVVCVLNREGKVLHSHKVMRDFPKCLVSPAGKFFSELNVSDDKGAPGGLVAVIQVRALGGEGKVVNQVKGREDPIGLLDDGRMITMGVNVAPDDKSPAVRIWEDSKPRVLVENPTSAIVQGKTVYYCESESPYTIRAVEIP